MKSFRTTVSTGLLMLMLLPPILAAESADPEISLVTIGQGDPVYIWFGHTALVADDPAEQTPLLYDYGLFDFQQDNFFLNFAMGRLIYAKAETPLRYYLYAAQEAERNFRMTPLNLPAGAGTAAAAFLKAEVQPDRNTYLYHHYDDNCSTRIRDIIDEAVGGQFRQWAQAQEGRMTIREHFSRHSRDSFFMLWLLNFLQGSVIDRPITRWDELFLPFELEQAVEEFSYLAEDGRSVSLSGGIRTVLEYEHRQPVPETWDPVWPKGLALGLLIAALTGYALRRMHRCLREGDGTGLKIYGSLQIALGGFFGLAGTILLFMMLFTDHDVTRENLNILMVNPLWLAAVYYGIMLVRGKAAYLRHLDALWRVIGVLTAGMVVIRLGMTYPQGNQLTMALLIPVILVQGRWQRLLVRLKGLILPGRR